MTSGMASGAAASAALIAGLCVVVRAWRRRARLDAVARRVARDYARLLAVKQKQLVIHDGYGNYELKAWIAHVDYFIAQVILREARAAGLPVNDIAPDHPAWARLRRILLAAVNAESEASEERLASGDVVSGEHYETLCRDILGRAGWTVSTTPVTGDQGADLIAEAAGCRVVIQCKFYGRPVGNKAVQEAAAALAFHAADHAAVVSNAGFTRSATSLARANAVLLLHHDELVDLADTVGVGPLDRAPRGSKAERKR